jgi:hypothetical protein
VDIWWCVRDTIIPRVVWNTQCSFCIICFSVWLLALYRKFPTRIHGVLAVCCLHCCAVCTAVATAEVVNVAFNANFCIMFFFVWELKPNLQVSLSVVWATEKFLWRDTSCSSYLWFRRLLGRGICLVGGDSVRYVDKVALEHGFLRRTSTFPSYLSFRILTYYYHFDEFKN